MKAYTITVNGTAYDVEVEEKGSAAAIMAPKSAPAKPAASTSPESSAKPASNPKKKSSSQSAGSVQINSPMPGKIISLKTSVGQEVKRGDVVLILEAMKMENEIPAVQDGVIASIQVAAGDMVEAGDVLATLK
ncbi:MAG: biotin/lipoyl-binding protein [Lachnoclostridium sp.]|jgi:biotin carboxyl carrier protein|nr:biotin/lipoyl-binding protein [Lachnoclostridium sp.]